jgi:hypothetical protein
LVRGPAELEQIIESEGLRPEATRAFIDTAFRDGAIQTTGTAITTVLPAASRFSANSGHAEKKQRVLAQLGAFFERFFGLSSNGDQQRRAHPGLAGTGPAATRSGTSGLRAQDARFVRVGLEAAMTIEPANGRNRDDPGQNYRAIG